MSKIISIPYNTRLDKNLDVIDLTSKVKSVFSPFLLRTPFGIMENVWQYSKVYPCHVDINSNIKDEWFVWHRDGLNKNTANRYPMGKGSKPLFSFYNNERLSYIEARKKIYIPMYVNSVLTTRLKEFELLKEFWYALSKENLDLYLRDFDGYDRHKLNMSIDDVINCESKTMGHCFVIEKMLLEI